MKHPKKPIAACVALALAVGAASPALVAADAPNLIELKVHEGTSMSVAASPDGKWLAIDLQGSLWILPSGGGKARRITDWFDDSREPVWAPDGKTLAYFSFHDGGYDLWAIKPEGGAPWCLTEGPFDDREPAFSPDGKKIVFASDRGTPGAASSYNIWTLELAGGKLEQLSDNPYEDRHPAFSADGGSVVFTSVRDNKQAIYSIALADKRETVVRAFDAGVQVPSYSPKGQLAYVLQGKGASWLEVDGRKVSGNGNVTPFPVSWSKDGTGFYVADGKIHKLAGGKDAVVEFEAVLPAQHPQYVHAKRDWDSTAPRKALGIVRPAISPNGKQVAFIALGDLWLSDLGGTPRKLTDDHFMDVDPAWSPDGGKLVYSSDKGGKLMQLWIRDLKTGKDRQLTAIDTQPIEAVWSPDGKRIAFLDADGMWGVAGLEVVDADTGKITRLQPSLGQPGRPTWSADGKWVALSLSLPYSHSFREGTNQIFAVKADGSGESHWYAPIPHQGIDTRGGDGPVWSPDGTMMAAVYSGDLAVWPVSPSGEPLGPPRTVATGMAYGPSWAADSQTLLFQHDDTMKTVDIATGKLTEVPPNLNYTLSKPQGRTVIHAGHAFDGKQDKLLDDVDIVIDGNRISYFGAHDAAHYANANVVEAPGLTAMPGLIEFHAHPMRDLGSAMHRAWLAYGVTTVRDPGDQPYHGVESREANEAGVLVGPRLYATGNLVEWQREYYKMGIAISSWAHLEKQLELSRALKYDLLKSYVHMPDQGQKRIVEFAHEEMGVPVATHEIYPAALVGVDNTEHMGATSRRGFSPKQTALGRSYQDVVDLFGKTRRDITPTNFGALDGYVAKHPELRNDPRVDLYPNWAQDTVRKGMPLPPIFRDTVAGTLAGIKALHDAGAVITAGTDEPIAPNLHAEIASYVDAGLTPFQALQTATVNSATQLGLDAGVLENGKLADIILIDGNPLADIASTIKVKTVVANGRVYSEEELLNPIK